MTPWRPGQHDERLALEKPYEDVPDHLVQPLLTWIGFSVPDGALLSRLLIKLRIDDVPDPYEFYNYVLDALRERANADHNFMLNLIEQVLHLTGNTAVVANLDSNP